MRRIANSSTRVGFSGRYLKIIRQLAQHGTARPWHVCTASQSHACTAKPPLLRRILLSVLPEGVAASPWLREHFRRRKHTLCRSASSHSLSVAVALSACSMAEGQALCGIKVCVQLTKAAQSNKQIKRTLEVPLSLPLSLRNALTLGPIVPLQ